MRNRYDYVKSRYSAWCLLKSKTGNHYDPTTNKFNFTDAEWTQHSQANTCVSTLKNAPLLFPDLCKNLYDGAAATGVSGWGPSSKKSRTIDLSDDLETLETDDFSNQSQTNFSPNSEVPGSQANASNLFDEGERPTKKTKTSSKSSKSSQLENKMINALDLMVQHNSGPSLQECKEKLNKLGWGTTNPLHHMALGIFCESASYRRQWMLLDENENETWVKMVSKKLGFNV
ncbi:hypothetical protein POM88_003120 [Heracleum sosnowskyi]|uniref:Myb/SANT-like domain-containing protein n=1 Tax=Heracleum sosnowskyi TaxID=360622 RepID=A0AAD8N6L0_9APIA|nr:hypothetical protein POM88_003120 [Heracleum sosnowskyi]